MQCPSCHREVPDHAQFCPFCGGQTAQPPGAQPQPVDQVPVTAPTPQPAQQQSVQPQIAPPQPPVAPTQRKMSPWLPLCAVGCGLMLLIAIGIVGVLGYRWFSAQRSTLSSLGVPTQEVPIQEELPTGAETLAPAPVSASGLAGDWEMVYSGSEGDLPDGLSLVQEGDGVVGTILGRFETTLELSPGPEGVWMGWYTDPNIAPGTTVSGVLPGADRLRVVDEDSPGGPYVLMIADRRGGSDFGPNPRAETEDQAIAAVADEPDVSDWLAQIEAARQAGSANLASFEVEEDVGDYWVVHAFEQVDDGGGMGHTATYGRYLVFKRSGFVALVP